MYDPFYWYEKELDNDYWARQHGYEDREDYLEAIDNGTAFNESEVSDK